MGGEESGLNAFDCEPTDMAGVNIGTLSGLLNKPVGGFEANKLALVETGTPILVFDYDGLVSDYLIGSARLLFS